MALYLYSPISLNTGTNLPVIYVSIYTIAANDRTIDEMERIWKGASWSNQGTIQSPGRHSKPGLFSFEAG
jgi:hypothetical protein